jgi:ankyrin repeat protein
MTLEYQMKENELENSVSYNQSWTPLHKAIWQNDEKTAQQLITFNAKKNPQYLEQETYEGFSPLRMAIFEDYPYIVLQLVQAGVDISATFNDFPLIVYAASESWTAIVVAVIARGTDVNTVGPDNWTALHHAAFNGDYDTTHALLKAKANPNILNIDGDDCISVAMLNIHDDESEKIIALLISNGANFTRSYVDDDIEMPMLVYAAKKGWSLVVHAILKRGTDVEATDSDGWTALHYAAKNNYTEIILLLLKCNTNVNAKKNDQWTPLHLAAANRKYAAVKYLIEGQANIHITNDQGEDCLDIAIRISKNEPIRVALIAAGANMAKTFNGMPFLVYATRKGWENVVAALIHRGADVKATDSHGCTALDYAKVENNITITFLLQNQTERLIDYNDDTNVRDLSQCIGWVQQLTDSNESSLNDENQHVDIISQPILKN